DGLDMSNWDIVVNPTTFFQDMAAAHHGACSVPLGHLARRRGADLAESELTGVCGGGVRVIQTRGSGADIKDGALVVDIVDKSGAMTGTSHAAASSMDCSARFGSSPRTSSTRRNRC
ncbi:hypothetical protein GS538_09675, partial [Rhodococcus hoagii]|nr:hypothetical protein [Prescottella equi]